MGSLGVIDDVNVLVWVRYSSDDWLLFAGRCSDEDVVAAECHVFFYARTSSTYTCPSTIVL